MSPPADPRVPSHASDRDPPPDSRNRARLDLRLLPAAATAWALAAAAELGWVDTGYLPWLMGVALVAALLAVVLGFRPGRRTAVLLAAALPAAVGALVLASAAWGGPTSLPEGEAEVEFTVTADPRRSASGASALVPARVTLSGATSDQLVVTSTEALDWVPGQRFTGPARVDGAVFVAAAEPAPGEPSAAQTWRRGVRDALVTASSSAPGPGRTLLPGLVLGDTRYQDPLLADDMRTVSMTHLTAVSGSNLAIASTALWWLAAGVGAGVRVRSAVALLGIVGYAWLVGPEPSVLRAVVMASAVLLGLMRGSLARGLPILLGAIVVLMVARPALAAEPGFLLSVLACAGILLLAGRLAEGVLGRWPRPLALMVAVPLAAQIFCAPVVVFLAEGVSPWAVPANIVASPAVAPATILGLVAVVGGMVQPAVAVIPAWLGVVAAGWIAGTAQVAASAPLAALAWPAGAWGAGALVVIGAALAVGLLVLARRPGIGMLVIACAGAGALVASTVAEGRPWPPRGWALAACDVGQGSASVIALPEPGRALLVDVGPDPALLEACLDDLGVRRVDLVLSHFDADHVDGLPGLRRREILSAVVSPAAVPAPSAAGVRRELEGRGLRVEEGVAGGGGGLGEVRWSYLWPETGEGWEGVESGNDASVVVRVDAPGVSVLLPGDIGEEPQRRLARTLAPVDVIASPHHGSGDMDERLYQASRATVGIVSVGADNRYGHPTRRALAAMGPAPVLRTDLCGGIAVTSGPAVATQGDCGP